MWRSVPATGLYGCRRMVVAWTAVETILCCINLHFFWTAEYTIITSSVIADMNNKSLYVGFGVAVNRLKPGDQYSLLQYNHLTYGRILYHFIPFFVVHFLSLAVSTHLLLLLLLPLLLNSLL